MTKGLHKKNSKRVSARRRYKIEKKIREHNKKQKRLANKKLKNGGNSAKRKKEVQIPNKCPFKEDILREAQERRQKTAELKERRKAEQKAQRLEAINKRRNLKDVVTDVQKRINEHDKNEGTVGDTEVDKNGDKAATVSLRAYFSEVKKVIEMSDVILEVVDARDPLGGRCSSVEESVLNAGKRLVIVLNKIDLVPKSNVENWLTYLRLQYPTIAFKASTQEQRGSLGRAGRAMVATSKCIGADLVMKMLGNYCRNKDVKTAINVGVVGFPNVGKSSLINSLKRKVACNVGATPGVTKNLQHVQLDKKIRLVDSPGVVLATEAFDPVEMALKNTVRVENLQDPVTPAEAIVRRCEKSVLQALYNVPEFSTTTEFLCSLARRYGKLGKGGVPRIDTAAKMLIQDWNNGKIRYFTEPPEDLHMPEHVNATLVETMSKEFDLDAIKDDEQILIDGLSSENAMDADGEAPAEDDELLEVDDDDDCDEVDDDEDICEMDVDSIKPSGSVKTAVSKRKGRAASPPTRMEDFDEMKLEGNKRTNRELKKQAKRKRKDKKRLNKMADKLSDALDTAMSSLTGSSDLNKDAYDFDEHFK